MPKTVEFKVNAKIFDDDLSCDACDRCQADNEKPEDPFFYMKIDGHELMAIRCSCCGHTFFMATADYK